MSEAFDSGDSRLRANGDRHGDVRTGASCATPEWSRAIATLKEALASVETACNTVVMHAMEMHARSADAAKAAAQHVADVRSESDAAVQRARLERELEVSDLRATVEQLRTQLQSMPSCSGERASGHADADAIAGFQPDEVLALEQALKASRAECAELARRVNDEQAKRVRLISAIRSLQRRTPVAVDSALPVVGSIEPAASPIVDVRQHTASPADAVAVVQEGETSSAPDESDENRAAPAVDDRLNSDAAEYARSLLAQVGAVYDADASASMPPSELIERLAANLKYGKSVFERRFGLPPGVPNSVFDQQLEMMLDTEAGTLLGRHLAIAAYEFDHSRDARPQVA